MRRIAAAIATMTRRFNLNEGLTCREDRLPKRLHEEALPSGKTISAQEMEYMLKDYYTLREWDNRGVPPADGGMPA